MSFCSTSEALEACLLNKGSCLAAASGVIKFVVFHPKNMGHTLLSCLSST